MNQGLGSHMDGDQQIARLPFLMALDQHRKKVDLILQERVGFLFCYFVLKFFLTFSSSSCRFLLTSITERTGTSTTAATDIFTK